MQGQPLGHGHGISCRITSLRQRLGRHLQRASCTASNGLKCRGIAACAGVTASTSVLVFASTSQSAAGSPQPRQHKAPGPLDFGSPLRRCTDVLLALNAVAFVGQWLSHDALMVWGAKVNSLIATGQLWRLITSSFLHTSFFHLLINSHALHTIGPHLELVAGPQRFVTTYALSALVGTTASFLFTPAPSVGASGALFGVGAALAVFYWRHKATLGKRSDYMLQQLGITLAINMVYSLANRRIDNWGHLGGMLGGAVVAWFLGPRLVRDQAGRLVDQPPLPIMARQGAFNSLGSSGSSGSTGSTGSREC